MANKYMDEAIAWATKPATATGDKTNWEVFTTQLKREASLPYRKTIMRSQVARGMSNNCWPILSRLAIMDNPNLVNFIHPRHVADLDDKQGYSDLQDAYMAITGHLPICPYWQAAKHGGDD